MAVIIDFQLERQRRAAARAESARIASGLEVDPAVFGMLDQARDAQRELRTADQLAVAERALDHLGEPTAGIGLTLLVDALGFQTDALCNANRAPEAQQRMTAAIERHEALAPRAGVIRRRAPRSLPALQAARLRASATELAGDPDEAVRHLVSLNLRLRNNSELGEDTAVAAERLRVVRGVLSAAKRSGGAVAHRFATYARNDGDTLADRLEWTVPHISSSYYYRAALERRTRDATAQGRRETADLLRHSLSLRAASPRDDLTKGMAQGEELVQSGHVAEGASLMSATVLNLLPFLPRHHASALAELVERDLLLIA